MLSRGHDPQGCTAGDGVLLLKRLADALPQRRLRVGAHSHRTAVCAGQPALPFRRARLRRMVEAATANRAESSSTEARPTGNNIHDMNKKASGSRLCPAPNHDATGPCGREVYAKSGGEMVCQAHHRQFQRLNEFRPLLRPMPAGTECSGPGHEQGTCGRVACHWDLTAIPYVPLCKSHYVQRRTIVRDNGIGELTPIKPKKASHPSTARDEKGRKRCCMCEQWLDVDHFGPQTQSKDGLNASCRACGNASRRLRSFGLTQVHFSALVVAQGNACAICGVVFDDEGNRIYIDHDHSCCPTSKTCGACIRGLLCNGCNSGIGWFKDSTDSILSAVSYLQKSPRRRAVID